MYAVFSAIFAFLISSLVTPFVRKQASRFEVIAKPNHRTVHKNLIPKLGGLSIYLAFAAVYLPYYATTQDSSYLALIIGGAVVLAVGFLDDVFHLTCYKKLIGQTIAASIAVYSGFALKSIYLPFGISLDLGFWGIPISLIWIIAVTNAVNLIDGLDGLAAGFALITSVFFMIFAAITGSPHAVAICLFLAASVLGFLLHNFVPARIFMGDTGSLFLGFMLACLSMKIFSFAPAGTNLLLMFVAFALPLTDMMLAIVRRLSAKKHPFTADKQHIHHLLLSYGFGHKRAVLIVYATVCLSSMTAMLFLYASEQLSVMWMFFFYFSFLCGLYEIGCFNFLFKKQRFKETQQLQLRRQP